MVLRGSRCFCIGSLSRNGEVQGSGSLNDFAQRKRARDGQNLGLNPGLSGYRIVLMLSLHQTGVLNFLCVVQNPSGSPVKPVHPF